MWNGIPGVYPAPAFPRKSIPCAVRGGQGYGTGSAKREARLSVVGGTCQYMVPYCQICLCGTLLAVCLASFRGRGKQKYKQFKYKDYEH